MIVFLFCEMWFPICVASGGLFWFCNGVPPTHAPRCNSETCVAQPQSSPPQPQRVHTSWCVFPFKEDSLLQLPKAHTKPPPRRVHASWCVLPFKKDSLLQLPRTHTKPPPRRVHASWRVLPFKEDSLLQLSKTHTKPPPRRVHTSWCVLPFKEDSLLQLPTSQASTRQLACTLGQAPPNLGFRPSCVQIVACTRAEYTPAGVYFGLSRGCAHTVLG